MCGDDVPGIGNRMCKGPKWGRFWQVPGVERRPVGPKVGIERGTLILGNDTEQVGRSQIVQDLTDLREGFGLYRGEIRDRPICILGRWLWLLCVQQPGGSWSGSRGCGCH